VWISIFFAIYLPAMINSHQHNTEGNAMAEDPKVTINEMVQKLQTGEMNPGSAEGIDAIRQIAKSSPGDLTTRLYHLPNDILERGMKAAGMSDDDIEDILKSEDDDPLNPKDPFSEGTELTQSSDMSSENEPSPFEYDPGAEMRNGPRR
jgi:hypothetical protein